MSPKFSFLQVLVLWSLHAISVQIQNPYGDPRKPPPHEQGGVVNPCPPPAHDPPFSYTGDTFHHQIFVDVQRSSIFIDFTWTPPGDRAEKMLSNDTLNESI